jgi:hypothetical protein
MGFYDKTFTAITWFGHSWENIVLLDVKPTC